MVRSLLLFVFILSSLNLLGQQKYWVFLKDKKNDRFDPYQFFDEKAIERRLKHGLPLDHITDLPVNEDYIKQVNNFSDSISAISRWFNAVVVYASEAEIKKIASLNFVDSVHAPYPVKPALAMEKESDKSRLNEKLLDFQTKVLGREDIQKNNLNGKGVRIAVFDAGFSEVDKNAGLTHLHKNGKILKTYDFIRKKEFVYDHSSHGLMVLQCIAGLKDGKNIGLATEAEFLLARTEHNFREPYYEEEKWVEAMEWADQNGADLINSSLGYTDDRYFQSDMNGKTSLVSRAATMAARKGMLVMNAAGNEGNDDWKKIGAPADADSILTVGGTAPYLGYHIRFSSYGPTADMRMKPNVCAPGEAAVIKGKELVSASGTSFSTPLITGYVACIKQLHPDWTAMKLLTEIERSGRLYPYFDYAHGYGIPAASYFFEKKEKQRTFSAVKNKESVSVTPDTLNSSSDLLYYHIRNEKGHVEYYYVIRLKDKQSITLPYQVNTPLILKNKTIAVHYHGYTEEFKFD